MTQAGKGRDFREKDLEKLMGGDVNGAIVKELVEQGADRKSWLIFCPGVDHAKMIAEKLTTAGVDCQAVYGAMPTKDRDRTSVEISLYISVNVSMNDK